jgi:hypothetical protein
MGDDEDGPSRALVSLLLPLCSDAWVQCDHCELWRRVPKLVSERLGDDEQWYVITFRIPKATHPTNPNRVISPSHTADTVPGDVPTAVPHRSLFVPERPDRFSRDQITTTTTLDLWSINPQGTTTTTWDVSRSQNIVPTVFLRLPIKPINHRLINPFPSPNM